MNTLTNTPLIADFRLINHHPHNSKIWFACAPNLLSKMLVYGSVATTQTVGMYELTVHPRVDYHQLVSRLREIDGKEQDRHPLEDWKYD